MTHHDPAAAVALTLDRGDPWLAVFLVLALTFCVGLFAWVRIKPGIEQLRQWGRENGR